MKTGKTGAEESYLTPETSGLEEDLSASMQLSEQMATAESAITLEAEPEGNCPVGEITDLREYNRKVFQMRDGRQQAVFYPETVHVFNEDTCRFEETDTSLILEEDAKHFVNRKNRFLAKFSCEEENNELFSVESGIHRVTVSTRKKGKHSKGFMPKVCKKATEYAENTDTLIFADVQDGSDYEYSVIGDGVKENIIVKNKADIYRYAFTIRQENVNGEFDENNKQIVFKSTETGEEVFFIPAPFMTDANGTVSTAVSYEVKKLTNGDMVLNIIADSTWMNAEDRAFPVVIDPQIKLSGTSAATTYSWSDGNMSTASLHTVGIVENGSALIKNRMYLSFKMPTLPRNPRIQKAELVFTQDSYNMECNTYPKIGLYRVTESISTGNCTPNYNTDLIDFATMREGNKPTYSFDITTLVDQVNKGDISTKNLVLKLLDESIPCNNYIKLYGNVYGATKGPQLLITYESTYGVNTSYRTHTHELGRFGQGSIDLQCGNLMFESEDFSWGGNRMPVTVKHLYNSALGDYQYTTNSSIKLNTANFSLMKIGNGFKLNLMQSMVATSFYHEGTSYTGYVYIGENGDETYFKQSNKTCCCESNSQCYHLYEDIHGSEMMYDPVKKTLQQGDHTYQFDSADRLIEISDGAQNRMVITYNANQIQCVTDGAGRDFWFGYSGKYLTSITAPDETKILYTYSGDLLSTITYPDGRKATITYASNKPSSVILQDADGNDEYKVAYTFSGNRLTGVTEYGVSGDDFLQGAQSTYSYSVASGKTTVQTTEQMDAESGETEDNVIKTVYTFDDDGNIVSQYAYTQDTGNTGVDGEESGIHPYSGDGGMGVVSNSTNLLTGHHFNNLDAWTAMSGNESNFECSAYPYERYTKFGTSLLRMRSYAEDCTANGVYQTTATLLAGEYTFSAYVRVLSIFAGTNAPGAYIRVTTTGGTVLAESEHLTAYDDEYIRLVAPFTLTSAQSVQVQILVNGKSMVYFDGAQLEKNPYANAYNLLENGHFEDLLTGWTPSGANVTHHIGTRFSMNRSVKMTGDLDKYTNVYQDVAVKSFRSTRETFTLSGWAKGYGLPDHTRTGVINPPHFRLRAVVQYRDTYYNTTDTEVFTADFSPCTEEWQYASVQFAKNKYRTVQHVRVYCEYDHNTGIAYFDDIQLVRNSLERNLTPSDYTQESDSEPDNEDVPESTQDDFVAGFMEALDDFGNTLTETTFTDGEFGTIYRSFGFTLDEGNNENAGNDLIRETDARGNTTTYKVGDETSRTEEVTDRCGNKTAYQYDAAGRTTKVTSKNADCCPLAEVSYAYDAFDNMTEIARGDGMKYALTYNAFHNLESIGVNGKNQKLVQYAYKNGNGRLKSITYANGDTMRATYNSAGQMIAEKWYNASDTLTAHYKYTYDSAGNIVRSIDILCSKEYNYEYEEGKLLRATESDITRDGDIVTAKTVVNSIRYFYDTEGTLTKKIIAPTGGEAQTVNYEQDEDNTVVRYKVPAPEEISGARTITAHSKTDSFGRKVFDELQLGTGFVSRQFSYHAGEVTPEHEENRKLKSSPTTNLVSQITFSGGDTISYAYDAEERITSVVETYADGEDPIVRTTAYTYDALGQLVTETVNGITTKFKYDNYGNILAKGVVDETGEIAEATKITYAYGDEHWHDLLTAYNGQTITYDAQGNPLKYRGHTLTWEKGRQLKTFDGNTYTYNANGIRTSKTVNTGKHEYILDGTKILRETWGNNTLVPLYDNEESVCGILYNDEPFYFRKNLQGDIIAIVDDHADVVARYSYDAWGVPTTLFDISGCSIATVNPFRYRGYYYDPEIGLYYVSSRYYDPEIGRFLNSDDPMFLGANGNIASYNLFAYCENNPINMVDLTGNIAANVIGAIIGGVIGAVGGAFLGKWLADRLGITGFWARAAFIGAVGLLVGAAAAAIGYFIGPYVAKAWSVWSAKLSGLIKGTFKSIAKITSKKMSHINVSKHLWNKVMKKVTKTQIETLIYQGIRKGTWNLLTDGSVKILYKYGGQIIVITGKVVNNIFQIGNAWVWNGIGTP